MVPIDIDGCKYVPTDEERKVLHQMIDTLCDKGEVGITWEAFFHGDEPFTFKRKMMRLHMQISEDLERR